MLQTNETKVSTEAAVNCSEKIRKFREKYFQWSFIFSGVADLGLQIHYK